MIIFGNKSIYKIEQVIKRCYHKTLLWLLHTCFCVANQYFLNEKWWGVVQRKNYFSWWLKYYKGLTSSNVLHCGQAQLLSLKRNLKSKTHIHTQTHAHFLSPKVRSLILKHQVWPLSNIKGQTAAQYLGDSLNKMTVKVSYIITTYLLKITEHVLVYNMCQLDHLTGKEKETNCADLYYVTWEWNQHSQSPTVTLVTIHTIPSFYGDLKQSQTGQIKESLYKTSHYKDLRIYIQFIYFIR